ncbi:hypothetical protein B0H16DRAFT_1718150 [Mycena metata]|uniref:Uncharacterized protein n=1 Tax=Mycena metata TaxID=1033252 RepID=A0AAD7JG76_9AGAR|nr:hypothetical protein B0H16DRAFT_1718150 [Mycena metata]
MAAVSTDWPLILRMDLISHTPNLSLVSDRREIACPLVMKLGGQVEYELVARVIYIGPTADGSLGHYVTKTRLKGNTYLYDDTRRNGSLNELGPLHLLEDYDPNTALVLYHRTSQPFKTSRTVAEIQGDFEKIPVVPITIEIIPDVPNTAKPVTPTPPVPEVPEDDEVDQMIIDSIASPTKSRTVFTPPSKVRVMLAVRRLILQRRAPYYWKDKKTLWYPAKFIKHHKNRASAPYEYEFEWSACLDGTLYNTEFSSVPELRRIYHRDREFLDAIQYVKLSDKQIGNIRLPFYEDTNFEDHENPELTVIFNAAIPQIAKILAAWDQQHSAMQSLKRLARVTGIGLALLHFLVVQHELKEPLNLNGDLVNDLWDNSVITCGSNGKAALQAMYAAVNDGVLPGANESQKMSRFFDRHTIFDSHWRPPLYRRVRNSQFASTEAILVTVSTVSKRKAEEQLDSLKGPKRSKLEDPKKAKVQQKTKKSGAGAIMAVPGNNRRILPSRKCAARG